MIKSRCFRVVSQRRIGFTAYARGAGVGILNIVNRVFVASG